MAHQDTNTITIIGRLTSDPKAETIPTGTNKSSFAIANNYLGANKKQEVSFFDVVAWGKLADVCNTYLKKCKQVSITGRLQQQRWQDKQSGGNRSRVLIVIHDMQMLGSKEDGGPSGAAPSQASGGQPPQSSAQKYEDDKVPF